MFISELKWRRKKTAVDIEVGHTVHELDRIVEKLPTIVQRAVYDDELDAYICVDCAEETFTDRLISPETPTMLKPIDCVLCGTKLEYVTMGPTCLAMIDWLHTLVKRRFPLAYPHWYDLRASVEFLETDSPHWAKVEYIVYCGSALDPWLCEE